MNQKRTISITSLDLPELQPYRTLRRPSDHLKEGIFIAEGEKVVRRLLASPLTTISLLLTPEWYEKLSPLYHWKNDHQPTFYVAEKKLLETIVGFNMHQGVMAMAKIPEQASMEQVLRVIPSPHLLVALDGLADAENVGAIVRNCAAFGVHAILVGETSSSPYLRRAVRNSMGAVFHLQVVHVSTLVEALGSLRRDNQTRVIGADPHGKTNLSSADLRGNLCVVLGNEGAGLSPSIKDVCTQVVSIPMLNDTDSLNVSSAAAVFLHEASKHRQA